MAESTWPELDTVKLVLGVTTVDRDQVITDALAAAIEQVQVDVGTEVTNPSPSLVQAAVILAVMAVKAPDAPYGVAAVFDTGGLRVAAEHPTYLKMLHGQRVRFGVA